MLRPDCIEQTAHLFRVLKWTWHYEVHVEVLMVSALMCKAPARHPHVLTLSGFAIDHAIHFVPVAAQEFVGAFSANGSAVHELERAKHIPVLRQQILHQCLSFPFALFKCHCGSPHVFINETRKLCRNGRRVMIALTNTGSCRNRDKYQCTQRIGDSI